MTVTDLTDREVTIRICSAHRGYNKLMHHYRGKIKCCREPRPTCVDWDLARRLSELRRELTLVQSHLHRLKRALTLARRPSGLRHALDLVGLIANLSPRELGAVLSPREPRA